MTREEVMEAVSKAYRQLGIYTLADVQHGPRQITIYEQPDWCGPSQEYVVTIGHTYNANGYITGWHVASIQPPPDREMT